MQVHNNNFIYRKRGHKPRFFSINFSVKIIFMKKLGAFIIPTGVGAKIGGFAGDASIFAQKFAQKTENLIVNPNVVNAGVFSGIVDNMLYVEGYSLDEFFKGNCKLNPNKRNKIGVVFDKAISQNVLNIHINTINAVKTVYGIDIIGYEITNEDIGVEFFIENNISTGNIKNISALDKPIQSLLNKGAEAIAIVCRFSDEELNEDYQNGIGIDPVGGIEAIISHYISKKFKIPTAHSPAFEDYSIDTKIVNSKASAEYITPTFLPCILLGLNNAPKITAENGFSINDLEYLIMPYDCLGGIPVIEAIKRNINVFAIKENSTCLNVDTNLFKNNKIQVINSYEEALLLI